MNARVVHFETPEHREADLLLPWHAAGTLEPHLRARMATHLAACARCQRETEWLRELQTAAQEPFTASEAEIERAWQRLRVRLDTGPLQRSLAVLRRAGRAWSRAPVWMRWALAAQLAICAILTGTLVQPTAPAPYRTLAATAESAQGDALLRVKFDPDLTQGRLRDLLRGCGARIVDGPDATGAYVLAVPRERVERVLITLRGARGVRRAAALSNSGTR